MVVACIALLVALGGTSYATVLTVPRGSVGTPELKRNAVTASKINLNAVRAGHVLDGSLLVEDFKPGQIPQGPKGDMGDKGDKGDPGSARAWAVVDGATESILRGSKVTSASKPGTGLYCVQVADLNVNTVGAVVTPFSGPAATGLATPGACSTGGSLAILVQISAGATLVDRSFTLLVP